MRFERFANGKLVVQTLTGVRPFSTIKVVCGDVDPEAPFNSIEQELLRDHMRAGGSGFGL